MEKPETKPCLVPAGQGFSVKYKERFLYSRRNPEKNISEIISRTEILPGTLVFCFSPLLCYGIPELLKKLPENCFAIAFELENELIELTEEHISRLDFSNFSEDRFTFILPEEAKRFPETLNRTFRGDFKRILKIDFSAAANLNRTEYERIFEVSQNIVNQFWKNRITLVKFGRLFSANLFKNLKILPESRNSFSVDKAILVLGAGESAEETLRSLKESIKNKAENRDNFFIIAVDASLQALKASGIKADAAICEESQSVIQGAFAGTENSYETLFSSLSANHNAAKLNPEKNVFYSPVYSNSNFLRNLYERKIINFATEPLGSVGLSAVFIALKIRENENIPVFVSGLDFSYSKGKTHIKSSFHENTRRKKSGRLKSIDSFESSFSPASFKEKGKDGKTVFTDKKLKGYRDLFEDRFSAEKNLFDIGKTGLDLGIKRKDFPFEPFEYEILRTRSAENKNILKADFQSQWESRSAIRAETEKFISEEKNALSELKEILSGKTGLSENERNTRILEILENREYLYLHFPDGHKASLSLGFLKRVRSEIDYFLKILDT